MKSPIYAYRIIRSLFQLPSHAFGLPPHSCRLVPSCSHYCEQAVDRFGFLKGGWLCLTRIIRCNPLTPAGPDPLPDR